LTGFVAIVSSDGMGVTEAGSPHLPPPAAASKDHRDAPSSSLSMERMLQNLPGVAARGSDRNTSAAA
jgi:hypothetical protein